MNLRPYLLVIVPVLLWSMQTTSTSWFLDKAQGYSPVEVVLYRSIGAMLFALVVSGATAFRNLRLKQFVPGVFLALNFFFFNAALQIALSSGNRLFGPLLMTIEASNFVFCLPILWLLRKPAQVSGVALITYVLGMFALGYGAFQDRSSSYMVAVIFALLTSVTFGFFNCTVDLVGKKSNRLVPVMVPIFAFSLLWVAVEPYLSLKESTGHIAHGWAAFTWDRFWSLRTVALLGLVGFIQTGVAYFCWSRAGQRFSALTLALAFLWTVPISYGIAFIADPLFKSNGRAAIHISDFVISDGIAVILLVVAFVLDNKNYCPKWKIVIGNRRTINQTLKLLDQTVQRFDRIKTRNVQIIRDSPSVQVEGQTLISFATSDYLGLAGSPAMKNAAAKAIEQSGWGPSSARSVAGSQKVHGEAEAVLAALLATEESILFPSAYAANLAAFEWLSSGSIILHDEASHGSVKDGIRLSNAEHLVFRHGNIEHLEDQLNRRDVLDADNVVIVTDGVFSLSGEIAILDKIGALARRYNCFLFVDDTHGTGVLGKSGAGTPEFRGCNSDVHIVVTSLAKALGCPYGGVLAGRREVINFARTLGRSYHYSQAVSPVVAEMAIASTRLLRDVPANRENLEANLKLLKSHLPELAALHHPMFGILFTQTPDNRAAALFLFENLMKGGILPGLLAPPYTPIGHYSIRVQLSALHTPEQVQQLAEVLSASIETLVNSDFVTKGQISTARSGEGWHF